MWIGLLTKLWQHKDKVTLEETSFRCDSGPTIEGSDAFISNCSMTNCKVVMIARYSVEEHEAESMQVWKARNRGSRKMDPVFSSESCSMNVECPRK